MSSNQVKPKSFHSQCIGILSKYVECHDPLQFELVDMVKGVYVLRNTTTSITMDGKPHFYILQVKNSKGLFLHLSVTLKAPRHGASLETNHEFEGISVQFLQGAGRCLCRAEWDVKKSKEKLAHPQPHWHWGGDEESKETAKHDTETVVEEQGGSFLQEVAASPSKLPSIDFEEMHYAMASKWATQDSATEDFTVQRLCNWLKNCIANVIDQYNYQVNKGVFVSSKTW